MTRAQQLGITEFPYEELDSNGNMIYSETSSGFWVKCEYNSLNKVIFEEYSIKTWYKLDYDKFGNQIYYEASYGDGWFRLFENNKLINQFFHEYKEHYITYKRDLLLNKVLND